MPHGIARWGVFGPETWSIALGTSCLLIIRVLQQPMQRFKVNECVTPFEKDPPTHPKTMQTPVFGTFCVCCGIFSFLLQRSKKEKNASLHSVAWFPWEKMHSDEKIVGAGVWPSLFLSQFVFGFFPHTLGGKRGEYRESGLKQPKLKYFCWSLINKKMPLQRWKSFFKKILRAAIGRKKKHSRIKIWRKRLYGKKISNGHRTKKNWKTWKMGGKREEKIIFHT